MEFESIFNLSNKIKIYLTENKLSILKLANLIPDMKYQTLKRIIEFDGAESIPNISSLICLANFFNCTLSELISNNIILKTKMFLHAINFSLNKIECIIKLYIPIDEYLKYKTPKNIFAMLYTEQKVTQKSNLEYSNFQQKYIKIQIFIAMATVEYEGYYLIEFNNLISLIKVISVSTSFLMIENNNEIEKLEISKIQILAKYISDGLIIKDQQQVLIARE